LVRGTRNHAIKLRPIVVINADVVHDNVVDLPIAIFAFHQIDDRNLIAIFANHLGIDFSVVLAHGLTGEADFLTVVECNPAKINVTEKILKKGNKFLPLFRRKIPPVYPERTLCHFSEVKDRIDNFP
jgi:hypothetical protein